MKIVALKPSAREVLRQIQDGSCAIIRASHWMLVWRGIEITPISDETFDSLIEGGYINADTWRITEKGREVIKHG